MKTNSIFTRLTPGFFTVMLLCQAAQPAHAAAVVRNWDGGSATSGNWTTAANWQGNVAPVAGDTLSFPAGAARLMNTNNFPANTTFAEIRFIGDNYNIFGNAVTLTNGLSAISGADGNVFRPNIRLGDPIGITVSSAGSQLTVLGDIDLSGHNLTPYGAGELHCTGAITGTGNVTKYGSGRVVFDGFKANTYAGTTTVADGILELNKFILINPGAIRSPRIAVPGDLVIGTDMGPLIGDAVQCSLQNQIAVGAEVTVHETGELNLNGYNNTIASLRMFGGHVATGTGTLSVSGTNIFCNWIPPSADNDGSLISGRLNYAGAGPKYFTVLGPGFPLTVSAVVTAAPNATLVKVGSGELRLTGPNTYTGPTLIQHGSLLVYHNQALGSGTNGVTLECLNAGLFPRLWLSNSTIGGKTLTARGVNTYLYSDGLASSWNGSVVLEDRLQILTMPSSTLNINGGISGPGRFSKGFAGVLQLTGGAPNTYAGETWVYEGQLRLAKTNAIAIPGALEVEGDAIDVNPGIVRAVSIGGGAPAPDQIADLAAVELVGHGRLILEYQERIGSLAGSGNLELGSELEVGFDNTSTTFSGAITGVSGELSKIGAGTLTLSGNSSHSLSRVEAGALLINGIHGGSVNVWTGASLGGNGTINSDLLMQGGTMGPGSSPGRLRVNHDVKIATAPSVFRVELNGTATTLHDQLVVGNALNLAGISLDVIPGLVFPPSSQFTIIDKLGGPPAAAPFDGLPEGATLNASGQVFQITYQGGAGHNDVVLTRGASLISSGLRHTTMGHATLTPGPAGSLMVGSIGSSGEDGVFIPLCEAQGWQAQLTALDPSTGQGRLGWEIQGQRGNLPLQPVTRGYVEVISGEIHAFADSSAVGATAHWVEVFAGEEFLKNALVPSNAPLFRLLPPFTNPPAMMLRCEGPFPGKPYWHSDISWPQPRRVAGPGADDSSLEGVTRVRVRPWRGLANAGPPFALQLTAKDISAIRISDEALLSPPMPRDEGLPHRALGQAQFEARSGLLILTNIGSTGQDGLSIEAAGRSSGIGILTAPISLTPNGTMLALEAIGTFDGMLDRSMGTASLRTVGAVVQAMADFTPVGSATVRVEVFRGSSLVGSAMAPAGLVATLASPIGQGGAPSLDAVGWVPPCLLPVIDGIAQSAFEPLPCYYFHFDGLALFTLQGSQQFVGDSLRLLTANDQPRAQSLTRLDVRAALMAPDSSLALNVEKLRLPAPQITRVFPLQARSGEIVEILGRGFGNDPFDLHVVGSARVAGQDQFTVPFHVLSASDTRILARVGPVPPGTPGGPIQVYRGVGNEGTPQGATPGVEFTKPIRAWREGTPSGSFTLETVYQPPSLSAPPEECFQSGPPVQGVLCLYLYQWFPNAVVSFNSHVSAAFASGSASVDAFGVRFLGNGDLFEGAQRLAQVLEAAFAQQAGLIVNVEATRPQDGTVKLTLNLPSGFITGGSLNVCVQQGELVLSVVDVYPLVFTEGDLITINGQGFGEDARDLRVGLRDTNGGRFSLMQVLRTTDSQILARMGPVPPDFTQGSVEVHRGEGYRVPSADPAVGALHEIWQEGNAVVSSVDLRFGHTGLSACYYSTDNTYFDLSKYEFIYPAPGDHYRPPVLVLPGTWPSSVEVTIHAVVYHDFTRAWIPVNGTHNDFETTINLPAGGTSVQNITQIIQALRDDVAQGGGHCLSISAVADGGGTFKMTPYFDYACRAGWMGEFSVCVRPVPGSGQIAQVTTTGNSMTIHGSGFGTEAEDLSVAILDGGSTRLIPLHVLAASDTEITVRMGTAPPDALPGPVVVTRGKGSFNPPQPFFDDTTIGSAWTWLGRGTSVVSMPLVAPAPTQPEPGRQWFFSEPPTNGDLFVMLGGDWPNGAIVSIAAGIHDSSGGSCELNVPTARFTQAGNPVDCAERIADVIRSDFWQQAALAVDVKTTTLPGGQVKLSLSLLDGFISRGFMTMCVSDPTLKPQMNVQLRSRHVEVSWTAVGTLEEANHPSGPWRNVAPAPVFSPHFEPALAQTKFYRLRKQ